MNLKHLFYTALAACSIFAACEPKEDLGPAKLALDPSELNFEEGADSKTVSLTATRDWSATVNVDWVELSAKSGDASAQAQTLTVTVKENEGNDRNTEIVFSIGTDRKSLKINQKGKEGEVVIPTITCAEFISKADENTDYRLVGVISSSINTQYCLFDLTDETGTVVIWTVNNKDEWVNVIKMGGTVSVYGKYMRYEKDGNVKHEMVDAYIESFEPAPEVDPSKVETITCAEFIAKADPTTSYRLIGLVTSAVNTQYCSFDLTDDTGTVVIWTVNNKDDWADVVKKGGKVSVYGKYMKYEKDGSVKHEMVDAYIESFEEITVNPSDPQGEGTLDSPYNAAGVCAYIDSNDYDKDAVVYVKGKISKVSNQFDANYGTARFDLSDDGTLNVTQFTCYSVYYLGNQPWMEGCGNIKVGDDVIVCGKVTLYNGDTYETQAKAAYLYSLNGNTEPEVIYEPPTPGDYSTNVTWEVSKDWNSYDDKAKVNGSDEIPCLKLGKSAATGHAILTLPEGSSKLDLWAVSWNNENETEIVFLVDDNEVARIHPAANSGLSNNSPYTLTVKDSDHYQVDLGTTTDKVTVQTDGSKYRAALFGIKAE